MDSEYAGLPPFKRCESHLHGLAGRDFRRLLNQGVLVKLAHGLVAGRDWIDFATDDASAEAVRVLGMLRRYPDAMAAGRSAAALRGLWLIRPVGPVHLYREHGYPRLKYDIRVDPVARGSVERCDLDGVPATSLVRSAVDAGREAEWREAVAIFDSALRQGAQRSELLQAATTTAVRALIEFADRRSESALESVSRWQIHEARLPEPELQVWFYDDNGVPTARTDFYWRALRLIGEADGQVKYDDAGVAKAAEVKRQRWLEERGERVIRWGWAEAVDEPGSWIEWLDGELRAAADRVGVPYPGPATPAM